MTIMTQGDSDGTRRCDATCHTARQPKCNCICGGRYHGRGSSAAAQEALTEDWLGKDWRQQKAAVEAAGGNYAEVVRAALSSDSRLRPGTEIATAPLRIAMEARP